MDDLLFLFNDEFNLNRSYLVSRYVGMLGEGGKVDD
jgi:hypothetical protein